MALAPLAEGHQPATAVVGGDAHVAAVLTNLAAEDRPQTLGIGLRLRLLQRLLQHRQPGHHPGIARHLEQQVLQLEGGGIEQA